MTSVFDSLGLKRFGRKTKPTRPTRPLPLRLKLSTAHASNDSFLVTVEDKQVICLLLNFSGNPRNVAFAMADTPQHNGVAESLNCCLMGRTRRAILHQAALPKLLLAEAIYFAVQLKNRTSTKSLGSITPYERLYREKSNLANVPEWRQRVWVYNASGTKLDLENCKLDG